MSRVVGCRLSVVGCRFWACALLVVFSLGLFAGELPLHLDLETAERLALAHSPLIREATARREGLEAETRDIQSLGLPRLNAEAGVSYDGNPVGGGPEGGADNESWRAGLRLDVPISSFGRVRSRLDQARAASAAAAWDARRVRNELRFAIRELYLATQLADRAVQVQERSVEVLAQQVEDNEMRLNAGAITRLPVMQSQVALANARTALLRAQRDRALSVEALRATIGLPYPPGTGPEDLRFPEAWPDFPPVESEWQNAMALAEEARPEFFALQNEMEALRFAREVADFSRRPDLGGFVTAGFENERFGGDDDIRETWMFGVQFSLPLYDGGQRPARLAQFDARKRELGARIDAFRLGVETEIREALTELQLALALKEAGDVLVEQAAEALRLAREAQANGRATQLDVSTAELDLTRARLERHAAQHDTYRARARLLYVVGE